MADKEREPNATGRSASAKSEPSASSAKSWFKSFLALISLLTGGSGRSSAKPAKAARISAAGPSSAGAPSVDSGGSGQTKPPAKETKRKAKDKPARAAGGGKGAGRLVLWLMAFIGVAGFLVLWIHVMIRMPVEERRPIAYKPLTFDGLAGWSDHDPVSALTAWLVSCEGLLQRDPRAAFHPENGLLGLNRDWQPLCRAARRLGRDPASVRAFFEAEFVPALVLGGRYAEGRFTGYYEPELNGRLTRRPPFTTPIRALPPDIVTVDLGVFRPDLNGERVVGRVSGRALVPYETRAEIQDGALGAGREKVLAWVDDPVDAFFLHIQGSGRITLPGGEVMRVGYAGQNGHPYHAIGRVLIDEGELERSEVSMQSIRAWLAAHPERAQTVMNENKSYIFFREIEGVDPDMGPLGAEGVPLTTRRSLAVDARHHAYGAPFWVETTMPADSGEDEPFRQLMISQDTGGAIRGVVRGDIYWGTGSEAASIAGRMNQKGRFFALLPRAVVERAGAMPEESPTEGSSSEGG